MQPLLLLKQTLESPYDPGPLKIDGPNVEFTAADQFFSRLGPAKSAVASELSIAVSTTSDWFETTFKRGRKGSAPLTLTRMTGIFGEHEYDLQSNMDQGQLIEQVPAPYRDFYTRDEKAELTVVRNRCFFDVGPATTVGSDVRGLFPAVNYAGAPARLVRGIIHVPGLRGNPERLYPVTAIGTMYPGQFQTYVASIIAVLDATSEEAVHALGDDLRDLGLTWRVRAVPVSDTQVEIQVGRTPQALQGGAWDLVSIADVGFGVSQVLPVLVALRVAEAGQLIYVEQPEIHLHPRAQVAMAGILANAVRRGVRVVLETHSDLLLLATQTLVAEGVLGLEDVALHWFRRGVDGVTDVSSARLDEAGGFGEWPEDFADVQLRLKDRYLEFAEAKLPVDSSNSG